ncbi:MAG: N-acetyltransferase [bacterium]
MDSIVEIRALQPEDSADMWRIRNHEMVRCMSHDTSSIPRAVHDAWFARYIANPENRAFVLVCDSRVAGYCRIDHGLVSIAIDPEFQGRGFSRQLLTESILRVRDTTSRILAEVRRDNPISLGLFTAAGFGIIEEDGEKYILAFPSPSLDSSVEP